jgi:hypothetical protein
MMVCQFLDDINLKECIVSDETTGGHEEDLWIDLPRRWACYEPESSSKDIKA